MTASFIIVNMFISRCRRQRQCYFKDFERSVKKRNENRQIAVGSIVPRNRECKNIKFMKLQEYMITILLMKSNHLSC